MCDNSMQGVIRKDCCLRSVWRGYCIFMEIRNWIGLSGGFSLLLTDGTMGCGSLWNFSYYYQVYKLLCIKVYIIYIMGQIK